MPKSKTPWIDEHGEFSIRNVASVREYLRHKTGIQEIDVRNTGYRLIINYVKAGSLKTIKCSIGKYGQAPLYTIGEELFTDVIKEMME